MKFFSLPTVLSFAVIAASSATAETCVLTELATTLVGVITPATACQSATGYTILPPSALPTAAQVTAICSQCQSLITAAKSVSFPSCTLTIGDSSVAIDTLFNSIVSQCSASTSTGGSTSGSGSTPTVTAAVTDAPSTTLSMAGSSDTTITSDASTSSSLLADTDITSPSTTTATPSTTTATPSTTSSSAVQTVGAAVVIVATAATTMLL